MRTICDHRKATRRDNFWHHLHYIFHSPYIWHRPRENQPVGENIKRETGEEQKQSSTYREQKMDGNHLPESSHQVGTFYSIFGSDDRWPTQCQQAEHVIAKPLVARTALSWLMAKQRRSTLISTEIMSMLIYGISIWADSLSTWKLQRKMVHIT